MHSRDCLRVASDTVTMARNDWSLAFQFRQNKGVGGGKPPGLGNPAGEAGQSGWRASAAHRLEPKAHGHSIVLPPAALGD